jgi:hypothetical protein
MAGNIIGEPINDNILKQIDHRQTVNGAGYNNDALPRTPKVLNFLNNRNAWIKMASGVSISKPPSGSFDPLSEISKNNNNYITNSEIENLRGVGLAKNLVLFNTIQSFEGEGEKNAYVSRSGARNDNTLQNSLNKMYGGIGDNNLGLQPVGGITSITVENINRGSIRKATVELIVYNKFQFELIELAYLKLGYIMMLEWGWDKYIKDVNKETGEVEISNMSQTIIEKSWFDEQKSYTQRYMLNLIDDMRIEKRGNYDGFFGKVSNFSWKINTDGSYSISIDLITLGSVIESMKVNLTEGTIQDTAVIKAAQAQLANILDVDENDEGTYDNELINNVGNNTLSQFLFQSVLTFPDGVKDYVYSPSLATEAISLSAGQVALIGVINPAIGAGIALAKYLTSYTGLIPEEDRYYIRLGLFLDRLKGLSIPFYKNGDTKSEATVDIDTDASTNICNYVTNLIPLDPTICVFSFNTSQDFYDATYCDVSNFNSNMEPFAVEEDGLVYGQIMNINMNINFLQKTIKEKIDSEGELKLFDFLEAICDGINECTGGATMLEPAIKDDCIIYLLEQNAIKGFGFEKSSSTPIEIMGYSEEGKSNFVKDFSFATKITPDMMSMISIGATAEGGNTREVDASPWKKWYSGVVNRFEESYTKPKKTTPPTIPATVRGRTAPQVIKDKFKAQLLADQIDYDHIVIPGYDWTWKGVEVNDIWVSGRKFFSTLKSDSEDENLLAEVVKKVHEVEDNITAYQDEELAKGNAITVVGEEDEVVEGMEYKQYFINAFGGKTGTAVKSFWSLSGYSQLDIDRDDSLWWLGKDNAEFIGRGKTAFKTYIANLNNKEHKLSGAGSSLNGFIPVELSLTVDGISGIKIYQKLEVNQRFLPASYPNSLRFIIRGVNHKVESNNWTTELQTISTTISDTKATTTKGDYTIKKEPASGGAQTPVRVLGPIPPKNPNEKLKIYDNRTVAGVPFDKRTYKTYQGIDWLVGEMNIHTQTQWRKFLNILNERYPGYELKINATYRTYLRSIQLKAINSSNATAGKSPHNYAYAVDMNIKDPTGKTYLKKDYKSWKASGIPAIAVNECKMRWGGDFSNYLDCVHFDVTRATSATLRNAEKDNKGKPRKEWVTNNTNYV